MDRVSHWASFGSISHLEGPPLPSVRPPFIIFHILVWSCLPEHFLMWFLPSKRTGLMMSGTTCMKSCFRCSYNCLVSATSLLSNRKAWGYKLRFTGHLLGAVLPYSLTAAAPHIPFYCPFSIRGSKKSLMSLFEALRLGSATFRMQS